MAEQCLSSSTDIPSALHVNKESNSLDTADVNYLIRRSLSNKLNISAMTSAPSTNTTLSSASSTGSLTIYCIETGSIAQSIRRRQSLTNTTILSNNIEITTTTAIDEGRLLNDNDKPQEQLTDVEKTATVSDGDNESFDDDDDDETIIDDSLYPQSFPTPPNYVSSPCPICLEPAVLQVSPCCYFLCCNSCWRAHISSTINDGRIKIPCVANECNKYLTRESIVNFVRYDPPLHERYLKLYLTFNQNPRAKTCPRCCHLYSLDTIKSIPLEKTKKWKKDNNKKIPKQVQCSECSLVWCFHCSAPWHENMTCKQFIKGDKLLLKWINQKNEEQWNARKCPKCSSLIQRCPHMTCQSCSCEFCYLCGRRYYQIPLIGQHSNRLSMFGCPYNFYPEKPWLRRTIRGMIATGVVVASPIIVAGVVTAAVTVLPPFGIYKLVRHTRARRRAHVAANFPIGEPFLIEPDLDDPLLLPARGTFTFDLHGDPTADMMRVLRQHIGELSITQLLDDDDTGISDNEINKDFPLSIFADMDIEYLISDDNDELNNSPLDFRTCPTTPASAIRKGLSRSLNNLTVTYNSSINRHHSMNKEH
ncbi:unnamed protein product [Rotaria sp. Silwood2]|nr:unnamed protein product [Rotaria sp. Silwood2]CAF2551483.1 unnamed protein product [Rotaria sp. Silwood2]CAF2959377.1 unnamed protein product [Rotaria sp. Silwood2]CAF4080956.1 unnamed protein product [Rotaria sp. Silwood2]CAF4236531.1 unnamed protein product [Rotaria sp. Silwood2]